MESIGLCQRCKSKFNDMLRERISRIYLNDKAVPAVLLFVTYISFGLLIPWLGFYWDDWPVIYLTHTQGIKGFWDFYQFDRPFSAWTYIVFTPILGTNSFAWYVFVLGLRWLTAVSIWLVLKTLWQRKHHQAFWISVLFAACPLFINQQVAVAYSQHWICYLFYCLSLYWMLKAYEEPRLYYQFTLLAVALELVHLFTMEYFLGLELLRPLVLWIYFRERNPQSLHGKTLGFVARHIWVYFSALGIYLIWRLFILKLRTYDSNNLVIVSRFLKAPLQTVIGLFERALQDFLYLLEAWFVSFNPLSIELKRPFSLIVLAVILLAFIGLATMLRRYRPLEAGAEDDGWYIQVIPFGILATLLGMLPVWAIGRQVTLRGDRFSLAAMFGVCVILVAVLEWLSARHKAKIVVVGAMFALAIHINLYTAKSYQLSWEKQRSFYWQVFWRAPYIQPGTAFISDGEIFPFVGRYSTSLGIAMLYPVVDNPQNVPYWFFNYWEDLYKIPDELIAGTMRQEDLRNYSFSGYSRDSLLINFTPETGQCLEFFSPADVNVKEMPKSLQGLAGISNLQRISREPIVPGWAPPKNIFGSEPEHQWCYYYQKASLAGQYQDWDEVIRLLQEAAQNGFSPNDEREYLNFINAYIHAGKYDQAAELTMKVKGSTKKNSGALCALWLTNVGLQQQSGFAPTYDQVRKKLDCPA